MDSEVSWIRSRRTLGRAEALGLGYQHLYNIVSFELTINRFALCDVVSNASTFKKQYTYELSYCSSDP